MLKTITRFVSDPGLVARAALALFVLVAPAGIAGADPGNAGPGAAATDGRFSPRGIKGAIAIGALDPSSTQHLDTGSSSTLRIGYGIDEHITFWGTMTGSEHTREKDAERRGIKADVGGLEVSMQYAIATSSRLQPYGRFGFGIYSMEDRDTHDAWVGSGVTFGLGADYFLSKHWGVGLEATYRGVDYSQSRIGKKGDFRDLPDPIDADAAGFAFSVTVQ